MTASKANRDMVQDEHDAYTLIHAWAQQQQAQVSLKTF